jgi:antitoxin MazE
MSAKIQKWGNSFGVRIPKSVIEKLNLTENSVVEVEHKNGAIVILPLKNTFSLDSLLKQINKDNLHHEEDVSAEGNEVW